MIRLLLLFAICAVIFFLFKRLYAIGKVSKNSEKKMNVAEDMVACQHCGVHLPKSESLQYDDVFYCCEAHYRAAEAK